MGTPGTLQTKDLGFSIPCDAPLYPAPPYVYEGAKMMTYEYLTDAASAASLLPAVDGLELASPATAGLVFARYPSSSLGPYDEVVLFLEAVYQGQPVKYGAYLYVTTDAAMAAGREMGGFPKKIAAIHIEEASTYRGSIERPVGCGLAEAILTPEGPEGPLTQSLRYLTLRVIPSPVKGAAPSIAELVDSTWVMNNATIRKAQGTLTLTGASTSDPLHKVPVVQVLGCALLHGALTVDRSDRPTIPLR